jgi:hypothetical protein
VTVTVAQAERLAADLDLHVDDIGICHACLSFVSMAIDAGNPHKIRGAVQSMTPILWDEGLAVPARMALARARERGLANAREGLRDVEANGARSRTARAIVRRLGADLSARAKGDLLKMGFEPWPPRSR